MTPVFFIISMTEKSLEKFDVNGMEIFIVKNQHISF